MIPQLESLPKLLEYAGENFQNQKAFSYKTSTGWKSLTTKQFYQGARSIALSLAEVGVGKGTKVGIIAHPSPYWMMVDFAITSLGAVAVPLFANISPENLELELSETEMKYLFIDNEDAYAAILPYQDKLTWIYTFPGFVLRSEKSKELSQLENRGTEIESQNPRLWYNLMSEVKNNDPATIIYTSGSTGVPKGVIISHGNLISQIHGASICFPLNSQEDSCLSALPLAHVFERMVTQYYFCSGVSLYFVDDVKNVGVCLQEIRPTVMTIVPRLLEKVYAKVEDQILKGKGIKLALGKFALQRAKTKDHEAPPTLVDTLLKVLVFNKIKEKMGGHLRLVISGSAALSTELNRFFINAGVPLYEGYGCTETSPVISANFPGNRKIGTVGKPFPHVQVKFSETGEVLAKGPGVMLGYFNRLEATESAIDSEGWYHTGDKGEFVEGGYLQLKGRIKELFKTAGGKYVAPVPIEAALIACHPLIDMAMVIAEGRRYTACILVPNFEKIAEIKKALNLESMSHVEFLESSQLHEHLQEKINLVNGKLNQWEQIRNFTFLNNPLTVEGEELTPTMKIRRHIVEKKYKDKIESLFKESHGHFF